MGAYYVKRFWQEIDTSVAEKMSLPAHLMSQRALTFDSVTDFSVLEDLIKEDVEDAFITRKNGDIFYSVHIDRVGHHFADFLEKKDFSLFPEDFSHNHFNTYINSEGKNYKTILSPIIVKNQTIGFLYIKINSNSIQQRKNTILFLFMAGAFLTIFLTTLLEAYFVHRIIVPRLKSTLAVMKQVEKRDFSARIPEKGPDDELGELIAQVNSMIFEIEYIVEWLQTINRSGDQLSQTSEMNEFIDVAISLFSQYLSDSFSEADYRDLAEKLKHLRFAPEEQYEITKLFEKYGLDLSPASANEFYSTLYEKISNAIERQESISALKKAEEKYRILFFSAVEGIFRVTYSGKVLEVNPALSFMLGYESPEEMINTCNNVADHYESQDDRNKLLEQIEQGGHINDFDVQLIRKNGSSFSASITAQAVKDHNGNMIGIEGRILDISERKKRVKAELAREKAEAAERIAELASQAKSEFLANMSHELRTPLNAILGFSQIMERNTNISSELKNLKVIQRSGAHLLTLINQVLNVSKIEAGHITIEEHGFDLYHLLDELENMLSLKAVTKDLTLLFNCVPEVPRYILADEVKLRQVLINLLGNAIKFTSEGSVNLRISLKNNRAPEDTEETKDSSYPLCHNGKCMIKFEIEDTGPGIAPEEMDNLFKVFGQTATGREAQEGTGLGLAISRKFIQLMGGDIYVKSEVGQGTKFNFDIRAQVVDAEGLTQITPTRRVIALEPGQSHYRMLIVDDNWDNRKLLVKLLSPYGFNLREAMNGQEAVDIWETWGPHLILMDMRMPVMDGYEATKRIRTQASRMPHPVIIAVTANVLEEGRGEVMSIGCDDIVIKPFVEYDIFEMLEKHLKVKFIYETDEILVDKANLKNDELRLSLADFDSLPKEMVMKFKKSITALQMDIALSVIEEIREQNQPLADALQKLVGEFRFDTLQKLLDQNEQQ